MNSIPVNTVVICQSQEALPLAELDAELYQAGARVLHHVLHAYPEASTIDEFASSELAQNWPFESKGCALIAEALSGWQQADAQARDQQLLALKLDYGQLFFGPGDPKAAPWGSVYTSEAQLLNERTTLQLQGFYRAHGLTVQTALNEPLDHIGLIFAAMESLLNTLSVDSGNARARRLLETLLAEHLLPWSGRCLKLAWDHAQTPYYKGFAMLADDYLERLTQALGIQGQIRALPLYR
ncbi:molecular chaperone TorD family protein [Shewanella sp. JM162201]|uniref:Molecular chaperone TorD family protein n=1 Tax=Shewanella jiangmenensis TaxID=2837387 RepID=A0ABS5V324_9GAMM|nr:molecular chaperone TorD family protein [Shewanella jiangmenensis]MBT1444849.1 molecular chaperone TorD family protein [Shewanella jiangmenensis]